MTSNHEEYSNDFEMFSTNTEVLRVFAEKQKVTKELEVIKLVFSNLLQQQIAEHY